MLLLASSSPEQARVIIHDKRHGQVISIELRPRTIIVLFIWHHCGPKERKEVESFDESYSDTDGECMSSSSLCSHPWMLDTSTPCDTRSSHAAENSRQMQRKVIASESPILVKIQVFQVSRKIHRWRTIPSA
ncbi:hypothetical protein Dimus_026446 [Dionaea muscipula]